MPFQGERQEGFDLIESIKSLAETASVRDDIGAKAANIYLYSKEDGADEDTAIWRQMLPTPSIQDLNYLQSQMEGGIVQKGTLRLRGIPVSKYTREDLETDTPNTAPKIQKLWVVKPHDGKTRAYTTEYIVRRLITFNVDIKPFEGINEGELVVP